MDRIEYRKAWLVHMADMESLNVENSETWNYFMKRNFSLQKSDIPIGWYSSSNWWVVIRCDHAGEQVNREDKTCGGLKSITRIQNSRNQHYLVAPILAQALDEMMTKRLVFFSISESTHLQLSTPYVHRQVMWVSKLVDVLISQELGLEDKQYHHIKNFCHRKSISTSGMTKNCWLWKKWIQNLKWNDKGGIATW